MKVDFYKHNISDTEIQSLVKVLNGTILTTGNEVTEFEEKFANYMGASFVVGVTSWTMGAFITLKALGIGKGDEVITSPLSFISSSNIILQTGAKPVFVDVKEDTGIIDEDKIENYITKNTKAILPIHLYGQMANMRKIRDLANKYNLYIIEDSAHAIESIRDNIKPGQLSDAACFSFYATKNITSGEGGAVITNNKQLADKLKLFRLHGMSKNAIDRYTSPHYQHYDMELLGYKCNMDNIHATLLINQLELIEERLKVRERICQEYESAFKEIVGIRFPIVLEDSRSARHLFTIWVNPQNRDEIMWSIQEKGIGVAVNFRPIHLMAYYKNEFNYKANDFPIAEKIGSSTITIPLYPKLKKEEIDYVINNIIEVIRKFNTDF